MPVRTMWGGVAVAAAGALVAAAALLGAGGQAGASTLTASLSIDPASQTVRTTDASVSVNVSLQNVANMASWEFELSFDPDVLQFVSATADKTMLASLGSPNCLQSLHKDPASDVILGIKIGCAVAGIGLDMPGVDGSGKLAAIVFKPKVSGRSPLVFTKIDLGTSGSEDSDISYNIPATGGTGIVRVLAPGESSSGLEPTPTADPSLLTPTVISGAPTPDPEVSLDPDSPRSKPRSGVASGTNPGGSGNGNGGGGLSGATPRAGSANSGVAGAGVSGGTAAGGQNFPVAGQGGLQGDEPLWPRALLAVTGGAGALSVLAGAGMARRRRV